MATVALPPPPDVIVFFGPSGAGKTTQVRWLTQWLPGGCVYRPVAYTTRAPRAGERDGVDYHFVTPERFAELEAADAFLETGFFAGAWYGTHHATLLEGQAQARDATDAGRRSVAVLDLNQAGCEQLLARQQQGKVRVHFVVLTAHSRELEARMQRRGDAPATIAERLRHLGDQRCFARRSLPQALRLWSANTDESRATVRAQLNRLVYALVGYPGNFPAPLTPKLVHDAPTPSAKPSTDVV